MDFQQWIISEMPINKFQLVGDWGPESKRRGWDRKSIGILTNEKGVQRIRNLWSKSPVDFDLYFVRQKNASKFLEEGEVTSNWLKENLDIDLQPNENAITVLFTQNRGDRKIPMTAWTIGHRIGHVFNASSRYGRNSDVGKQYDYFTNLIRNDFRDLLSELYKISKPSVDGYGYSYGQINNREREYELAFKYLAEILGTMKSARSRNLSRFGEFAHELMGQVILTGIVRFNKFTGQGLGVKYAWGKQYNKHRSIVSSNDQTYIDDINDRIKYMAEVYTQECERILNYAVGRIFVM